MQFIPSPSVTELVRLKVIKGTKDEGSKGIKVTKGIKGIKVTKAIKVTKDEGSKGIKDIKGIKVIKATKDIKVGPAKPRRVGNVH